MYREPSTLNKLETREVSFVDLSDPKEPKTVSGRGQIENFVYCIWVSLLLLGVICHRDVLSCILSRRRSLVGDHGSCWGESRAWSG